MQSGECMCRNETYFVRKYIARVCMMQNKAFLIIHFIIIGELMMKMS